MTIFEFADGLNGREYGNEITASEKQRAKELGFIVVFGYSDDNTEFRGAYDEEVECFDGGRIYEDGDKYIDAVWCKGGYCWTYDTNIPHATFDIYEDGEKYCKGIVFEKCGTKATTHFDRIKAMSLEELVKNHYTHGALCKYIQKEHYNWCEGHSVCTDCIREFLESEVQEDD